MNSDLFSVIDKIISVFDEAWSRAKCLLTNISRAMTLTKAISFFFLFSSSSFFFSFQYTSMNIYFLEYQKVIGPHANKKGVKRRMWLVLCVSCIILLCTLGWHGQTVESETILPQPAPTPEQKALD